MPLERADQGELDPRTRAFYCKTLVTLNASGVPFLVGGAYAFEHYTGIARHTKDLDIFVRYNDLDRVLALFSAAGYQAEIAFPHWLAKVYHGEDFIDLIFKSGNGVSSVDDEWFAHAREAEILGVPARLCAVEEIIWTKAFIMERERCDLADVAHILRAHAADFDWQRLMRHFDQYWQVLLSHLIFFGFIYPDERSNIPGWVMDQLLLRLRTELGSAPPTEHVCQGTLLSRAQYLVDVERWGYQDARLRPRGNMTAEEIARWTAAIEEED